MKVLPIFRCYSNEPTIAPGPGFVILGLREYNEADVIVVHRLADIDAVCHDQLVLGQVTIACACVGNCNNVISLVNSDWTKSAKAVALVHCYGLGKILAENQDMVAFMENPTAANEQPMLCFAASARIKLLGIQLQKELPQLLACLRPVRMFTQTISYSMSCA